MKENTKYNIYLSLMITPLIDFIIINILIMFGLLMKKGTTTMTKTQYTATTTDWIIILIIHIITFIIMYKLLNRYDANNRNNMD